MPPDSRAGTLAQASDLVDVAHLVTAYYTGEPDPEDVDQQVAFGTSGHRGSPPEDVVQRHPHRRHHAGDLRLPQGAGLRRPALHRPGHPRAVRAGVGHRARGAGRQRRDGAGRRPRRLHAHPGGVARDHPRQRRPLRRAPASPTASWSRPSHNPPADGGFKYNPPHGGPADTDATSVIADRANELIAADWTACAGSRSRGPGRPRRRYDFLGTYVDDLPAVVDLDADQGGRGADRRRPAGRRERRTTGARSPTGTAST